MEVILATITGIENRTNRQDGTPFQNDKFTGAPQMMQKITFTDPNGNARTANCFSAIENPVFPPTDLNTQKTVAVTQIQKGSQTYTNIRLANENDVPTPPAPQATAPQAAPMTPQQPKSQSYIVAENAIGALESVTELAKAVSARLEGLDKMAKAIADLEERMQKVEIITLDEQVASYVPEEKDEDPPDENNREEHDAVVQEGDKSPFAEG